MNERLSHSDDTVAAQLRDLERQGGGMARLAHVCAGLLLTAFSLGSLISISGAAFTHFLAAWDAGVFDVPNAINITVNLLMVLCADVGLLYAASVLRVLVAAQAPASEQRVHQLAMIGASVLESATYAYMLWLFDRPDTAFLWAIGIARALASPLLAAYLSMARPLPVGPRDVAYQAALAAGKGVVRDVTVLSSDLSAPLERKVRIYRAAALMAPQDRTRFDDIIEAVATPDEPAPAIAAPLSRTAEASGDDDPPPDPPMPERTHNTRPDDDSGDTHVGQSHDGASIRIFPQRVASGKAAHGFTAGKASRNVSRETALRTQAFALLDATPDLSRAALRKSLHCRRETANALYLDWTYARAKRRAAR